MIAFFKLFIVGYVFGGRTSSQVMKLFKAVDIISSTRRSYGLSSGRSSCLFSWIDRDLVVVYL